MIKDSQITTDHEKIRHWVEERRGRPATVKGTPRKKERAGILRIDYPQEGADNHLEEITWDDFFQKFEESGLAFLYQDFTNDKKISHFSRFIRRSEINLNSG